MEKVAQRMQSTELGKYIANFIKIQSRLYTYICIPILMFRCEYHAITLREM